jgi:hypothetical protein
VAQPLQIARGRSLDDLFAHAPHRFRHLADIVEHIDRLGTVLRAGVVSGLWPAGLLITGPGAGTPVGALGAADLSPDVLSERPGVFCSSDSANAAGALIRLLAPRLIASKSGAIAGREALFISVRIKLSVLLLQGASRRKLTGQHAFSQRFQQGFCTVFAMKADGFTKSMNDRRIGDDLRLDAVCHAIGPGFVMVLQRRLHLFVDDHVVDVVEARFHCLFLELHALLPG